MLTGYTIERKIGTSHLAEAHLATQDSTGKRVTLKLINHEYSKNPIFRDRFLEVIQRIPQLDNPHAMPIVDAGVIDDQCYIAVSHFDGKTLHDRLRIGYPVEHSLEICQHIADVLSEYHQQGIFHGGVRTDNMYFDENSNIILSEPEIVKITCQEIGINIRLDVNTAINYSPEQAQGRVADAATDFYGLGLVLYELLQKQPAFTADNTKQLLAMHSEAKPQPLEGRLAYLQPLLNHLLCKVPDTRLKKADQFAQVVSQVRTEHDKQSKPKPATTAPPQKSAQKPAPAKKGMPIFPIIAILAIAGGATAAWFFLSKKTPVIETSVTAEQATETIPVPAPLPLPEEDSIDQLLLKAQRQVSGLLLIEPSNNNAYKTYQKILSIEPNNAQAKQGLQKITHLIIQDAKRQKNRDLYDSLDIVEQGLSYFPTNKALLALKLDIEAILNEESSEDSLTSSPTETPEVSETPPEPVVETPPTTTLQVTEIEKPLITTIPKPVAEPPPSKPKSSTPTLEDKVTRLFTQAKQQISANNLTSPVGNNAFETYQKLLKLAPKHKLTRQIPPRIAARYYKLAKSHYRRGNLKRSQNLIVAGLKILPNHQRLLQLKDKVASAMSQPKPAIVKQPAPPSIQPTTIQPTPKPRIMETPEPTVEPTVEPPKEEKKAPKIRVFGTF